MRKTRIVVPCYNESSRLNPSAFINTLEQHPDLSFLFINDGSSDHTLSVLYAIQQSNPSQVDVISLNVNSGKAEAVRVGFISSMQGSFDYIGYFDADLATPLDVISKFVEVLECNRFDMVIGSRVRLLGRNIERRRIRHYLGRIFATFASMLLRVHIYDTQCGAKLFKNTPMLKQVFGRPFKVKWTFDVEMLVRFLVLSPVTPAITSSRWVEYPLDTWVDVKGSKIKGSDFVKGGIEVFKLWFYVYSPARRTYEQYLLKSDGDEDDTGCSS